MKKQLHQHQNYKPTRIYFRNGEILKNDKNNKIILKKIMEIKNGRK